MTSAAVDPVANPGFTWWATRPRIEDYNPSDKTRQNRIDFVWFAGPASVSGSNIVGEADAPGVSIAVSPWPSDHRAVVSRFEAAPAPMPLLVATHQRVYEYGENIQVVYRGPRQQSDLHGSVVLRRNLATKNSPSQRRIAIDAEFGRIELPGDNLPPGWYQVMLLDADGAALSKNEFWILDPDATLAIEIGGVSFVQGESLPIAWSNAPGNRYDWVGIFDAAAANDSQSYVTYGYVGARSSGTMQLDADTAEDAWPLAPGNYVARLLLDDG